MTPVRSGSLTLGGGAPLVVIAGPCVIESRDHALATARALKAIASDVGVPLVFKASFDKANRTSLDSFRGPGLAEGLRVLEQVQERHRTAAADRHPRGRSGGTGGRGRRRPSDPGVPVPPDRSAGRRGADGRAVNIKKGQFLAPHDIRHAVAKVTGAGNPNVFVTERGTSFGYNNLVVDMRALAHDARARLPGRLRRHAQPAVAWRRRRGDGGPGQYIGPLARAGVAAGVDGVFLEVHEEPARARSDAQNALRLDLARAAPSTTGADRCHRPSLVIPRRAPCCPT